MVRLEGMNKESKQRGQKITAIEGAGRKGSRKAAFKEAKRGI